MSKETKVNCEVENCKHNDSKKCELKELDISCTCSKDDCEDKKETICNNFEKNNTSDKNENNEELIILEDDFEKEKFMNENRLEIIEE